MIRQEDMMKLSIDCENLSNFLYDALDRCGKTEKQIADEMTREAKKKGLTNARISQQMISLIIGGKRALPEERKESFLKALGISNEEWKNRKLKEREEPSESNENTCEIRYYSWPRNSYFGKKELDSMFFYTEESFYLIIKIAYKNGDRLPIGVISRQGISVIVVNMKEIEAYETIAKLRIDYGLRLSCTDKTIKKIIERIGFEMAEGIKIYRENDFFEYYNDRIEYSTFEKMILEFINVAKKMAYNLFGSIIYGMRRVKWKK